MLLSIRTQVQSFVRRSKKWFLLALALYIVVNAFGALVHHDQARDVQIATNNRLEERTKQDQQTIATKLITIQKDHPYYVAFVQLIGCNGFGMICDLQAVAQGQVTDDGGIVGKVATFTMAPLAHPPSSGIAWARDTLAHAGLVPQAYAQGIGFGAFSPFQGIWKVFRDFTYLILVLLMVVVGFMVMFQVGSGSQTAVTMEATLPRLVLVLIEISFSYAIVGLLIDVMYVTIIIIISMLGPVAGITGTVQADMTNQILSGVGVGGGLWSYVLGDWTALKYPELAESLWSIVPNYGKAVALSIVSGVWTRFLWVFAVGAEGSAATGIDFLKATKGTDIKGAFGLGDKLLSKQVLGNFLKKGTIDVVSITKNALEELKGSGSGTWLVSTIAALVYFLFYSVLSTLISAMIIRFLLIFVLFITALWIFLRILGYLFKVYTEILISVFFAPLLIVFDIIPGKTFFVDWFKGLFVNLMVFPLLTVLFLIVRILLQQSAGGYALWSPPYTSAFTDSSSFIIIIAGFILYSVPDILEQYKEKLGVKSAFGQALSLGVFFTGAAPIVSGVSSLVGAAGIGRALAGHIAAPAAAILGKAGGKFLETSLGQTFTKEGIDKGGGSGH